MKAILAKLGKKLVAQTVPMKWPALPLFMTMLVMADEDGILDTMPQIISRLTSWPEKLVWEGAEILEKAGMIELLYAHLNHRWRIVDYEKYTFRSTRLVGTAWEILRQEVFERDDWTCVYCGADEDLECDHVIPVSRGGSNEPENLATACGTCNASKRAKNVTEWLACRE